MAAAIALSQIAMTAVQTYGEVEASRTQDRFQRSQAAINSRLANMQAEDVIRRGEQDTVGIRRETRRLQGSQRAAFAGQGVDVNSGSAALIQEETREFGEQDVVTARANAYREAWGLRVEASRIEARSRLESMALRNERRNTVLTGGLNALSAAAQGLSARGSGFQPRNPTESRFHSSYSRRR